MTKFKNGTFLNEHYYCAYAFFGWIMAQKLFAELKPDYIVHTAAQPSHDLAASRVFEDFDVNASGTLNLLEACRINCPQSPFIHMSTNKVYGDAPNNLALVETKTRYDYLDAEYYNGKLNNEHRKTKIEHRLYLFSYIPS